ncbi:MAG: hypothetical protein ACW990_08840, partial [Promethearchaeota archaeon]
PTNTGYWTSSGKFVRKIMPPVSIIFGIISAVLILISFFSIDESFHLNAPPQERRSLKSTFKYLFVPAKDKEYMKIMLAGVTSQVSQFALLFTIIPFIAFVLGKGLALSLVADLYIIYIIISISTKFVWLLIWWLIGKFLLKKKLLKTYKLNVGVIIIAAIFELFFLANMPFILRMILFIVSFGTVLGSMYATSMFSSPIMNEMVDRAAEMHIARRGNESMIKDQAVTRLSGAYMGLFMFSTSIVAAFTSSIYGIIFRGENSIDPIILTLGLASMGILYFISFVFLLWFRVKLRRE